ncbi:MAG TPA: hypothetical protein PLC79_00465 [Phycisphaerae bacterium]|nr:hypothetical protein [Phycisphaerae bacterium]
MIRRLNYTGRRRIRRDDIGIRIRSDGDGVPSVDATLLLAGYRLPADARVFIEAYRQTAWQRLDYGTVGEIRPPTDRRLIAFGSAEGVLFRVKVVEVPGAAGGNRPARILEHAESIRPRVAEEHERPSLLPIDPGDFRDEVWRLEFDESGPPVLKVSRHLVPDWRSLPGTREFMTLALPEILRSILKHIVLVEKHTDLDDVENWRTQWLRFAAGLPGAAGAPPRPGDGDVEQWIDDAVAAFCRKAQIAGRFRQWWRLEE